MPSTPTPMSTTVTQGLDPLDEWWQTRLTELPGLEYRHNESVCQRPVDTTAALYPLHNYSLISVSGADASQFLQGQLSADIDALGSGQTVLAAHCDPKGRMHANFYLHCVDNNHYLLLLARDIASSALAALKKYAVFSKVCIEDISSQYAVIAASDLPVKPSTDYCMALESDLFSDASHVNNHSNTPALYLIASNREHFPTTIAAINSHYQAATNTALHWRGSADWEAMLVKAGIGFVHAQTVGEFIPQMLNFDLIGGISFTKGCYTGQEIIARMKYRGKVKRRCIGFECLATELPTPGAPVFVVGEQPLDGSEQPVGTVVSAIAAQNAISGDKTLYQIIGQAVIKTAALRAAGENTEKASLGLNLAGSTAKITLTMPPYAIPKDED